MSFPLKNRKIVGYSFGQKTFYTDFHIGTDYGKYKDELISSANGVIKTGYGPQGGNTAYFYPDNRQEMIRFLHLEKFVKTGRVLEGEIFGIIGYTGLVRPSGSNGAHVHIDISKNGKLELNNRDNFIDPEKYDWDMTNAIIVTDGQKYGITEWGTTPDGLETLLKSHGLGELPRKDNGQPDWNAINAKVDAHLVYHNK